MLTNLSPRNLSYILFKRFKLFALVLSASLVLYVCTILTQPVQYESTASVLVKVGDSELVTPDAFTEAQGQNAASAAHMAKQVINSEQVIITSQDVLRDALERVGVKKVYPDIERDAEKAKVPPATLAVDKLLKDISIAVNNETNVLMLSLFNTSPKIARATLGALVDATIDKQGLVMRDPRLDFLESKLESLKALADQARQELLEFKRSSGITSFDEERALLLKQRDGVELELHKAQSDLVAAEGRGSVLKSALASTPEQIELSNENDLTLNQVNAARSRLTAVEAQYQAARQRFTESNPELQDLEAQLESARKNYEELAAQSAARVRTGANPVSQKLSENLSTARSEADALRNAVAERERQLEEINQRLAYLDTNEAALRELEHQLNVADKDYQSYLTRVQSARILSDMNQAGITNLSVVQAPSLPYKPARPKKLLLFVLALFAGVAGGLGLCLFLEMMDDSIALPEQVEALTGLPLLAVVDEHGSSGRAG